MTIGNRSNALNKLPLASILCRLFIVTSTVFSLPCSFAVCHFSSAAGLLDSALNSDANLRPSPSTTDMYLISDGGKYSNSEIDID